MKKLVIVLSVLAAFLSGNAQDKKEMKDLANTHAAYAHKKFMSNPEWAMCKFSMIYKLTTANIDKDRDETRDGLNKIKTSSGAYAILNGLTDEDLNRITQSVGKHFQKRMKDEAGVNVTFWNEFKDSKNIEKLKESEEEREIYSKSQGLAYAVSYDNGPHYNKVIMLVPGGKKLSKELDKNVMEFTMVVDFAEVVAEARASISKTSEKTHSIGTTDYYKETISWSKQGSQYVYTGIRILPNTGSTHSFEMATDLTRSGIRGHDQYGYTFNLSTPQLVSDVVFTNKIEEHKGEIPEVLNNRRNNKVEFSNTFDVYTTPEKYEAAVLDALNKYLDTLIKYYNWNK